MFTVIGKRDLKAVTVSLSYSVAVNVLAPILSLILPPVGFVLLSISTAEVLLLQEAQLISDIVKNRSIIRCFMMVVLNVN
jgi:hypothetical protein